MYYHVLKSILKLEMYQKEYELNYINRLLTRVGSCVIIALRLNSVVFGRRKRREHGEEKKT